MIAYFGVKVDSSSRKETLALKISRSLFGILKEDPVKNAGSERLRGWALER